LTSAAPTFETLCQTVTKQFLRTAILIDDQIITPSDSTSTPAAAEPLAEPPFLARQAPGPVAEAAASAENKNAIGDGGNPAPGADTVEPEAHERAADVIVEEVAADPMPPEASVALKPLADAFLDEKIICAVLNPVAEDEDDRIIERAVNAASFADIVIIDWFLRNGDAELTLNSLVQLLRADAATNGRKRLIIVYTSAAPLEDRCAELRQRVIDQGLACVEIEADFPALRSGSSRIIFVEKSSLGRGSSVEELPSIALRQFAKEAEGLMSIFALGAIARIRDATHHMLSVFKADLDPALVGHRMVLAEPGDARDFALEVLMLQLRGILTADTSLDAVIDKDAVGAWFDHKFNDALDAALAEKDITRSEFRTAVETGNPKEAFGKEKVKQFHQALFLPEPPDAVASELQAASELARLSTHAREAEGVTPLPDGWLPSLTLGSVLRVDPNDGPARYYLCTQPLCDTLRLDGPTFFSFVSLAAGAGGSSRDYWLVVRSGGQNVKLKASLTGGGRHFARFVPDTVRKKIIATGDAADLRKFTFTDDGGTVYRWLADVDSLKAQRAAEEMASTLGRVGVDELEWLRMGGKISV
tara:strand:- start:276 stop:2042 length:1767 start_codon:yes stop_codon:yes gene_type:complete